MRKVMMAIAVLGISFATQAQKVNGINLKEIPAEFVEVVSTSKMFKPFQVRVYLDYGQISKSSGALQKGTIMDSNNEAMTFNGVMGVLNFMQSNGFEYVNQYLVSSSNSNVYHYLFRNKLYKSENK
tara:strand:+ start:847 stop:1224 length:378 start_codon:yes stop_codon:yes gene_type:complete